MVSYYHTSIYFSYSFSLTILTPKSWEVTSVNFWIYQLKHMRLRPVPFLMKTNSFFFFLIIEKKVCKNNEQMLQSQRCSGVPASVMWIAARFDWPVWPSGILPFPLLLRLLAVTFFFFLSCFVFFIVPLRKTCNHEERNAFCLTCWIMSRSCCFFLSVYLQRACFSVLLF